MASYSWRRLSSHDGVTRRMVTSERFITSPCMLWRRSAFLNPSMVFCFSTGEDAIDRNLRNVMFKGKHFVYS